MGEETLSLGAFLNQDLSSLHYPFVHGKESSLLEQCHWKYFVLRVVNSIKKT